MRGLKKIKLKSGMNVVLLKFPNFSSTLIRLYVPTGLSGYRNSPGLAHLAEHLAGNWLDKKIGYENGGDGSEKELFPNLDAATNRRYSYFGFDIHRTIAPKVVSAIFEFLGNFDLTEDDLSKEKKIIFSELDESIDSNSYKLIKEVEKGFGDVISPAQPIIGSRGAIKNIGLKDVKKFFEKNYRNKGSILVISGAVDAKLERLISAQNDSRSLSPSFRYGYKLPPKFQSRILITNEKGNSYCKLFYPLKVKESKGFFALDFAVFVMSHFIYKILEQNNSYSREIYLEDTWDSPMLEISFSCDPKNTHSVIRELKEGLKGKIESMSDRNFKSFLRSYTMEKEMDKDYPLTQAKNAGHLGMLFGISALKDVGRKFIFKKQEIKKIILGILSSPALLHIVGPAKKLDKKVILKALG